MLDNSLRQVVGSTARSAGHRFVEGRVRNVSPAGLRFTLPGWDSGTHVFGPAPWVVTPETPVAGDRCLVLFLGTGVDRPWVVGWWPA